jgi:hypothetical protein
MMRPTPLATIRWVAVGLLLAIFAGCGQAGPDTIPVSGVVTLDGMPCIDATIIFLPIDQTTGNGGRGVTDSEGKFVAHLHDNDSALGPPGLMAGTYKVLINKWVTPDGQLFVATADMAPIDSNAREVIPPRYSDFTLSRLKAEVPGDGKPLQYDLRSK